MTDAEKLAIAINALRQVRSGSVLTGRWIANGAEVGSDRNAPREGYYDEYNPPEGFIALEPACWVEYTDEEQSVWVESCACISAMALSQIEEKEKVNG